MYSCARLCFMIESSDKKEIMESHGITGEITVILSNGYEWNDKHDTVGKG